MPTQIVQETALIPRNRWSEGEANGLFGLLGAVTAEKTDAAGKEDETGLFIYERVMPLLFADEGPAASGGGGAATAPELAVLRDCMVKGLVTSAGGVTLGRQGKGLNKRGRNRGQSSCPWRGK